MHNTPTNHQRIMYATALFAVNYRLFLALADRNSTVAGLSNSQQKAKYLRKLKTFEENVMPQYVKLIDLYQQKTDSSRSDQAIVKQYKTYYQALKKEINEQKKAFIESKYVKGTPNSININKNKISRDIEYMLINDDSSDPKEKKTTAPTINILEDASLVDLLATRRSQIAVCVTEGGKENFIRTVADRIRPYQQSEAYKKVIQKPKQAYEKSTSSFKGAKRGTLGGVVTTVGIGLIVAFLASNPIGWAVAGVSALATIVGGIYTAVKSRETKNNEKPINKINQKYSEKMGLTISQAAKKIKALKNEKKQDRSTTNHDGNNHTLTTYLSQQDITSTSTKTPPPTLPPNNDNSDVTGLTKS